MASHFELFSLVFFGATLVALLASLSRADLKNLVLPDKLNFALALIGIAQSFVTGRPEPFDALLGGLLCGGILFAAARLYHFIRGKSGLGLGDQKFGFAAGIWIGWQQIPSMLLIAAITALLFVALSRSLRKPAQSVIPFGPFLSAGVLSCWLLFTVSETTAFEAFSP